MGNASSLIADAHTLLSAGSFGRARSLTVLAQEELGKALWIYEAFNAAWSSGAQEARAVPALDQHGRTHTLKYQQAILFGGELAEFWGDYSRARELGTDMDAWIEADKQRREEAETAAREANLAKQRGFYVDRGEDGVIHSPSAAQEDSTADDLQLAAQVIEMLLITDHTRMTASPDVPYDSTHRQQYRLLPLTHPEGWSGPQEG